MSGSKCSSGKHEDEASRVKARMRNLMWPIAVEQARVKANKKGDEKR